MPLNNQPYLPLFVDDWMNNNKLKMCSPAAHGLMISVMCIMHKEKQYGRIVLKQKFKQTSDQIKNFALQIAKLSAFEIAEVEKPLLELINEAVLTLEGEHLVCPRMVRDCEISDKRAIAGRSGGLSAKNKKDPAKANKQPKTKAKGEANTVIENEVEIEYENESIIEIGKGKEGAGEKPLAAAKVVYPFDSEEFAQQWQAWRQYRAKEHRQRYRSIESEQAALAELGSLSAFSEQTAIAIMHQSMGKGWKGFFEIKNDGATAGATKSRVRYSDDFRRKIADRLRSG